MSAPHKFGVDPTDPNPPNYLRLPIADVVREGLTKAWAWAIPLDHPENLETPTP